MRQSFLSRILNQSPKKRILRIRFIIILVAIVFVVAQFWLQNCPSKRLHPSSSRVSKLTSQEKQIIVKNLKLGVDWKEVNVPDSFHNATNKPKFFVYSAYFDTNEDFMRVIAITPSFSRQRFYCHLFDEEIQLFTTVPGIISTTKYGLGSTMKYSMAFILCHLDMNPNELETQSIIKKAKFTVISPFRKMPDSDLFTSNGTIASNLMSIPNPVYKGDEEPYKFVACVQPTFNFDRVEAFLEWVEFQKMMGVTHFAFYNMSIGPRVSCVMKSAAINAG
ncbi:uncharacterized protein LOC118435657 [Folsomia candida]|uniref:uncharacterized protein LOC118435657 n=1 Tax=Folsomia candida TaxID=158441 RepID=UPI0016053CD5|nr:uncharacterized protein LOC118435657 [Folsomia candida]